MHAAVEYKGRMAFIYKIRRTMAALGAISLAGMMFLTVADVVGRKFFLEIAFVFPSFNPLKGGVELIGILLIIAGSWGMGYCQMHRMNIRVDIIADRFPPKVRSALMALSYLIAVAVSAGIAWQVIVKADEYLSAQFGGRSEVLLIPYWPFLVMLAIGLIWVIFIYAVDFIKSISEVLKR